MYRNFVQRFFEKKKEKQSSRSLCRPISELPIIYPIMFQFFYASRWYKYLNCKWYVSISNSIIKTLSDHHILQQIWRSSSSMWPSLTLASIRKVACSDIALEVVPHTINNIFLVTSYGEVAIPKCFFDIGPMMMAFCPWV